MIVNKFAKKCQCCGTRVEVGKGFAYNNGNGWFTACASSACHKHLGLKINQNVTSASNVRKLTEDGKVYMPFDREALPLIKSFPGARFNPDNLPKDQVYWQVSMKPADLPRVLEIANKLQLEVPESLRELVSAGTEDSRAAVARANNLKTADGKTLYDFQKIGVEFLALHERAFLADDMGTGKALINGTKILTATGSVSIEDLKVGDLVMGKDGTPTKVIGVYPQGKLPTFKVIFSDGRFTFCSEDHLWAVQTPNWRVRKPNFFKVMSLKEIIKEGLEDHNGNRKLFIPVASPIQYEEKQFPIHPYILGALIANGDLGGTIKHHGLPEQRTVLENLGIEFTHRDYDGEWTFVITNKYIKEALKELDLRHKICYNKAIPEMYFLGSVAQRLALLQGLVDNDGTVSQNGCVVEYDTSSKQLSDDVIRLVRSLGGVITFSTRNPKYTYKGEVKIGNTDHRIRIKLPNDMCPVSIPFKTNRFTANSKYPPALSIADIVDNGEAECTCIAVEAEDHLYVTDNYIVTHNTVQAMVALPENVPVIVICPAAVKYNWRDEIKTWRPEYKVTICNGRDSFVFPEPGEIVIINYDILPKYLSPTKSSGKLSRSGKEILIADLTPDQEKALSETIIIGDEFHLAKNYKSIRSQRVSSLTRICKRVWALSGTPLMNRPQDLFGVLCAGNMNPFGSWDNFVRLFNGYKNQYGGYEFGSPSLEVPEKMKRVMLRRLKSEVLKDLPPKTYQDIEVDCDGALTKKLNDFLGKATGTNKKDINDVLDTIDAEDLPSFEQFSAIRAMLAESRIPAMLEVVESYEEAGTPLVVFSAHKAPIEALKDREGWKIITGDIGAEDRRNAVHEFQEGKLKGIALTIQAGGVGITLTKAMNALFVDLDWTPSWNMQSEDRLCIAKGQLVAVRDRGYIPIEEIVIGDEVFTHKGRWRKVLNIHSKQNRGIGKGIITTIKYKRFSEPLVSTHTHEHLVLRNGESKVGWVKAHEILPGDFVVLPKLKQVVENGIDKLIFPEELRRYSTDQLDIEQINGRYVKIPDVIAIDDDALFAFGLYTAQGFCSLVAGKGRFVSWSVHERNRHQLERISSWLESLGVSSTIYTKEDNLGIELRGYSIDLAHLFASLFGRIAPEKHIPDEWFDKMSNIQLDKIFKAYLSGDGYFRNSQHSWCTVSVRYAMQLNLLAARLGYLPCLDVDLEYKTRRADSKWNGVFTINSNPNNKSLAMSDDDFVYNPVSTVTTERAKKGNKSLTVYDIEVDEDESFLVGNAIVHNCRIGATGSFVLIMRMYSNHPLDRHIHKLLAHKIKLAYKALEASIKFNPPPPRMPGVAVIEETDEEMRARINAAGEEVERDVALGKLRGILGRESAKVNDVPEPELTSGRKEMLRSALEYMISICDGAELRDGMGFNKPDAFIARWVGRCLREEDDVSYRVLERILVRYRRQLKGRFEEIWKPKL